MPYAEQEFLSTFFMSFIPLILSLFLIFLSSILWGFSAYKDTQARGNYGHSLLWGLTIGSMGIIPGIIYLIIRKDYFQPHERTKEFSAKSKTFFFCGLSLILIGFAGIIFSMVALFSGVNNLISISM